jgi:rod shape-determining protein MreC
VNGIEKKMAVITASGLIGKVNSVNKFTSTVQLLSANDSKNRISAVILGGEEEVHGLIMGYDEKKKLLLLKQIPADAKVAKKQNVVTSGLGGIFPEGLPIGKVVKVVPDEYGLTQTAYIKPGADFYDIENVMVIQRKMAQPQSSDMVDDKGEEL